MNAFLQDALHEFQRYKRLAEDAVAQLADDEFFRRPAPQVNSPAIIMKHLAGNLRSRWTDFLTSDGEKPDRNRDGEFVIDEGASRNQLLAAWNDGWNALSTALGALSDEDLAKTVLIRGESHTVQQAVLRAMSHVAYHVGQILYLVRWQRADSRWLTVPPGQSHGLAGVYRRPDRLMP